MAGRRHKPARGTRSRPLPAVVCHDAGDDQRGQLSQHCKPLENLDFADDRQQAHYLIDRTRRARGYKQILCSGQEQENFEKPMRGYAGLFQVLPPVQVVHIQPGGAAYSRRGTVQGQTGLAARRPREAVQHRHDHIPGPDCAR